MRTSYSYEYGDREGSVRQKRIDEDCASLLTGFEVSNKILRDYHSIDSSPDALFGIRKEKLNKGSNNVRRSLAEDIYVNKQASLLAAAARTAEVSGLMQGLERTEGELVLMKRQLEESQGT